MSRHAREAGGLATTMAPGGVEPPHTDSKSDPGVRLAARPHSQRLREDLHLAVAKAHQVKRQTLDIAMSFVPVVPAVLEDPRRWLVRPVLVEGVEEDEATDYPALARPPASSGSF